MLQDVNNTGPETLFLVLSTVVLLSIFIETMTQFVSGSFDEV